MVLASPGPLLTPPPSSSPPKTPHWSYSVCHNSTPLWEPDPGLARLQLQQQAGTYNQPNDNQPQLVFTTARQTTMRATPGCSPQPTYTHW